MKRNVRFLVFWPLSWGLSSWGPGGMEVVARGCSAGMIGVAVPLAGPVVIIFFCESNE